MKKNKTVAIFSGYTLPHLGGVEKYTDNMANEFIKKGYRVIIVGTDYDFSEKYIKKSDSIINYRLPIHKLFSSRYPILKHNKNLKLIVDDLNQYKIDYIIVNTRFFLTSLFGAKYGHKKNIPVFLVEHGSQHLTVDNKILDFFGAIYEHALTHFVKKYVDQYYGVSNGACNWQKHFKIVSNGVWYNSINDFSSGIKLEKNKKNIINICYAGRIIQQKGVERLLDVFCEIEKKYPNVRLSVAGDGNQLSYLKSKYKSKKIFFLGKLDFESLKKLYAYTDIFVYAPLWPEGLPTSILEAGLLECAVIGSPQGGIVEVVDNDKTGILINDNDELYNAMEQLITDDDKRITLAKNIRKKVEKQFIWSETINKVIKDIEKYRK